MSGTWDTKMNKKILDLSKGAHSYYKTDTFKDDYNKIL